MLLEEGVCAPLHLGRLEILPPGKQNPDVPEWIAQARRARAIEHLGWWLSLLRSGVDCPSQQGGIVVHKNVQPSRTASQRFGLTVVRIVRVADHHDGAADG